MRRVIKLFLFIFAFTCASYSAYAICTTCTTSSSSSSNTGHCRSSSTGDTCYNGGKGPACLGTHSEVCDPQQ